MATRATISRLLTDGTSEGRYHHWDGYPSGLGHKLLELFNDYFDKNIHLMMSALIDAHPAGWSTIQKNWRAASAGFDGDGPECYCHGTRSEGADLRVFTVAKSNLRNVPGRDCLEEYNYVINQNTLEVRVYGSGWNGGKFIGAFYLDRDEPDWETFGEEDA
jgi:hypothetical protein